MKSAILTAPCLACGAQIIWAIVESSGLRMPVDPDPVEDGNVLLSVVPSGRARRVGAGKVFCAPGTLLARVVRKDEEVEAGRPRRRPHFATCPKAGLRSRRQGKAKE